MTPNDGTINYQITPETNQTKNLCQWLAKKFPRGHLCTCEPFVFMQINSDCSCAVFASLKNSSLIKNINIS